jgi:hypothetical protein
MIKHATTSSRGSDGGCAATPFDSLRCEQLRPETGPLRIAQREPPTGTIVRHAVEVIIVHLAD